MCGCVCVCVCVCASFKFTSSSSFVCTEPLDMTDLKDCVGVLTVQAMPEYAMNHGACRINENVREHSGVMVRERDRERG